MTLCRRVIARFDYVNVKTKKLSINSKPSDGAVSPAELFRLWDKDSETCSLGRIYKASASLFSTAYNWNS
jgi:hypothetical protein